MTALIPLLTGFVLDLLLGDPLWLPHPVVAIGRMIGALEKALRRIFPASPRWELIGGGVVVAVVAAVSFWLPWFLLSLAYGYEPRLSLALEAVVCYQVLATRCLRDAGMNVFRNLASGDLPAARSAVAMIVGRDTARLDCSGVTRATVETVAENASDGVVAPMLYFAVGGAPLALLYKAVNTMDSMLGYKNERYLHFGRAAARLDDLANIAPARLTALLMLPAAALCGLDWRRGWTVYARDRNAHTSPNAGHPESVCAGALGVRLGGDSFYGGRLIRKPALGDPLREIVPEDIPRATRLLCATASLCVILCCGVVLTLGALKGAAPWN